MKPILLPVKGSSEPLSITPSKIIAVGLNYREHINESVSVNVKGFSKEIPEEPVLFTKLTNCLIGCDDYIQIPTTYLTHYNFDTPRTDHEAELAVIIGKEGKNIPPEQSLEHILGYTCFNDVSQRNIQTSDKSGWTRGKSFDTFGPIGPGIVKKEDISDVQNLSIQCRKNGIVVQEGHTSQMIFTVVELIAYISRNFTLYAGDIIATGTPSGVSPLKDGDTVEVIIESIGILKNYVREM